MLVRPRRNRVSAGVRGLVRETSLSPAHLVLPLFVHEADVDAPIASMPGCARRSIVNTVAVARQAVAVGVMAVALFPAVNPAQKTPRGEESLNPQGLLQRCVRALKSALPELVVITDVALDP